MISQENVQDWVPFGYTEQFAEKDKYAVFGPLYSNQKPLRLGIVGMGGVAQGKHLPALLRLGITGYPVQLVAFSELSADISAKVSALMNCRHYADYREMFEYEQLDAISVLTPPAFSIRGNVIADALNGGLHVLSEKPLLYDSPGALETSLEQAETLIHLAKKKGLVFHVAFSKRFSPPYYNAHSLVRGGRIGTVSMVIAKMCQGWSKANLLENQCCHLIDQMRYMGGDIASVHAVARNAFGEKQYPIDNLCATIEFQSGAIGTVCTNSSNPSLKPWERLEVFGEKSWICVEDGTRLSLYDSEEGPAKVWQPIWPSTLLFDPEFSGFVGEIKHFCDAAAGRCDSLCSAIEGYRALEIACALHRSYETKSTISLPMRNF